MLIGELVPETLRYLRNNPASAALEMHDHIVVDEYQDLNRAEQELIDVLSVGKHLSIIGDVDQSIYRFRYANPDGIL
jgi:superfamily I DNA/RNA helicase